MKRFWFPYLVLSGLFFHLLAQESVLLYQDLSGSWQFKADPNDNGRQQRWFEPQISTTDWQTIPVPDFWDRHGFADFDGIAWYRIEIDVADIFSNHPVYLGLGGVDDEFDLWIDGRHFGHFGNRETDFTYYNRKSVHDVTGWLSPGKHLLVFRVVDWQGGGGIHRAPVALAVDSTFFMTREERIYSLAAQFPDALWPYWVQGKGRAWTVIGLDNAVSEGLVSWDGLLGSKDWPFSVSVWIKTFDGKIYAPEMKNPGELKWSLTNGYLPLPVLEYGDDKIRIRQKYAALPGENVSWENGFAAIQVETTSLDGKSRPAQMFLAVRPYLVNGRAGEISQIAWNSETKCIDINDHFRIQTGLGKPALMLQKPLALLNYPESPGDISLYSILPEKFTGNQTETDSQLAMNGGVFVWPVEISANGKPVEFLIPLGNSHQALDVHSIEVQPFSQIVEFWEKKLQRVHLLLPDPEFVKAYYASLGYIFINADQSLPHPGPLAYDLFWYRDTAYILAALLRNGYFDFAREVVDHLMRAQRSNGEFPPIFDLDFKPVGHTEWDSQGQAIFTLTEYARFTGDTAAVRKYSSNVRRGVVFLDSLQVQTPGGILPPSWSAEDLGPADWHHYWDNFWAIRGLQDAAWLASLIGLDEDADNFREKARILQNNTRQSYISLMKAHGIHWIPNGPEDLHGSSMARGTGPGLWPGGALDPTDPIVRESFEYYWEKWMAPYNGAYLHQGMFWPYAFELGTCYVLLGKPERAHRIIQWHLQHQTMPGGYAWGEQLDTTEVKFAFGDIPHGWVAADYVNLIRTMLLYEQGDTLILGAGISPEWLETQEFIGIENAPTTWGTIDYNVQFNKDEKQIIWQINATDNRAKGILLKIPAEMEITAVQVNGQNWQAFTRNKISVFSRSAKVIANIDFN